MESKDAQAQFGRAAENYVTSAWHNQPEVLASLAAKIGQKGGQVADIGTGTGHTAFAFAKDADQVFAVDITPEMLALVDREAEKLGLENVKTVRANAEDMPFEDGSLDGITCRVAAHHFLNVGKFVDECHRCLKPNGWFLLIDTINPEDDNDCRAIDEIETMRDPSHQHGLKVSEWLSLLSQGFNVEWQEVIPKPLEIENWMERMSVPDEDRTRLRTLILDSEAGVREYLNPMYKDNKKWFHLAEATFFARRK